MSEGEPFYHRNTKWFPLSHVESAALREPSLSHVSASEVFMALDVMPELLDGQSEWVTAHMLISVRPSDQGPLYSLAALTWLHLKFGAVCALCHDVTRANLFTDYGFCRWMVGRPYLGADPICGACNGKLHQFSRTLSVNQRFESLRNDTEYVAALREITKSSTFRKRVLENAGRNLRTSPRKHNEQVAA